MPRLIAVLEDNADRVRVMKEWLADRLPMYETYFTDDPASTNDVLAERADDVLAVSLDHDLYDRRDCTTELTGMIVAEFLAQREPTSPVLIHSTNDRDSGVMKAKLVEAGWRVSKVVPFDDTNWIGLTWYPALKKALRRAAAHRVTSVSSVEERD